MAGWERAARTQRRRWEGGRRALARSHAPLLVRESLRRRDAVLLDLAIDLVVPPLARVSVATGLGLAASLASAATGRPLLAAYAWGTCALLLAGYVARGVALADSGPRAWLALAYAPAYVAWKLVLPLLPRGRDTGTWVRTSREPAHEGAPTWSDPPADPRSRAQGQP